MAKVSKTAKKSSETIRKGSRSNKAAFSSGRTNRTDSERLSIRNAGNGPMGGLGKQKEASLEARIAAYNAMNKEHQQLAEELEMKEMQLDITRRRLRDLATQKNQLIEEILADIGLEQS